MKPLLATILLLLPAFSVLADFSGDYAPSNWTFHTDGTGSVDTIGAPVSIALTGSNNSAVLCPPFDEEPAKLTSYEITAKCDGQVSFDWEWMTSDDPSLDPGGYIVYTDEYSGEFTNVTTTNDGVAQSGQADIPVAAGETFGFAILSADNICGAAAFTAIYNFVGPDCSGVSIDVDIKPGTDPNLINVRTSNGNIHVAILGTPEFDVTTVDLTTLNFEGATPDKSKSGPFASQLRDVNADGETDLVTRYSLQETTGLTMTSTEACVTGETLDGAVLEDGCDLVIVK